MNLVRLAPAGLTSLVGPGGPAGGCRRSAPAEGSCTRPATSHCCVSVGRRGDCLVYAYDVSGKRAWLADRDLTQTYYVYDAAGRLVVEELAAGRSVYFEYDASGLLTKRPLPGNAVQAYWTYDNAGRIASLVNRNTTVLCSFGYARDASGQITRIDREGGRKVYYEYDALDRLTLERQLDGSGSQIYAFSYTFDAASNRATKLDSMPPAKATYYTYDVRNLLTREYAAPADVTTYFAYDAAQRMTSSRITGGNSAYFGHDQRSQIKRVDFTSDTSRYFAYNGLGERVRVVDDGGTETYWTYDGGKVLAERSAAGTTLRRYRYNKGNRDKGPVEYTNSANPAFRFYPAMGPQGIVQQVDNVEKVPQIRNEDDAHGVVLGTQAAVTQIEHQRYGLGWGLWKMASLRLLYATRATVWFPGVSQAAASGLALIAGFGSGECGAGTGNPCDLGQGGCPGLDDAPTGPVGGFGVPPDDPRDDGGAGYGEEIDIPCTFSDQELRQGGSGLLRAALVPGDPTAGQTNYNLWYYPTRPIQRCCSQIAYFQVIRFNTLAVTDNLSPDGAKNKLILENGGSFVLDDKPSAGGTGWTLPIQPPPLYPYQVPWIRGAAQLHAFLEDAPGNFEALTFPYNTVVGAATQELESCAVCVNGVGSLKGAILSCFRWQHFADTEGVKIVEILSRRIFVSSVRALPGSTFRLGWVSMNCCRPTSNFLSVAASGNGLSDRLFWR